MGGIGKTTLAVKLVQQVAPYFDCVLWRSLYNAPSLVDLLLNWLQVLSPQRLLDPSEDLEHLLALLLDQLQARRCLLLLDNPDAILREGLPQAASPPPYQPPPPFLHPLPPP